MIPVHRNIGFTARMETTVYSRNLHKIKRMLRDSYPEYKWAVSSGYWRTSSYLVGIMLTGSTKRVHLDLEIMAGKGTTRVPSAKLTGTKNYREAGEAYGVIIGREPTKESYNLFVPSLGFRFKLKNSKYLFFRTEAVIPLQFDDPDLIVANYIYFTGSYFPYTSWGMYDSIGDPMIRTLLGIGFKL
jgi:hypothetical protein